MKISKVVITIDNFGNDDMLGDTNEVISRVLKDLSNRFKISQPVKVLDSNGQSVGKIEYE